MAITRQRGKTIDGRIRTILLGALIAVLLLAPLPFGSVGRTPSTVVAFACLALGALWTVWRYLGGRTPIPWKHPVLIWGAAFAAFGLAQTIPIPRAALAELSPSAAALRSEYEPAPRSPGDADAGITAAWRPISLDPGTTRRSSLWFLACIVAALLASDLAAAGEGSRALAATLVAGGGFQAIYGLVEHLSGRGNIFGYAKEYYSDVATGTFINRNHFAGYLEMTLPLAVAFGVALWSHGPEAVSVNRSESAAGRRAFAGSAMLLLALVMATALLSSRSRMGIASLALALIAVTPFLLRRGNGKAFGAALIVLLAVTALLFSQGAGAPILDRFLSSAEEIRGGIGRWSIWSQAMKVAAAFPLFGVGLGSFGVVFPLFRTTGEGTGLAHAHSDVVELAVETGVAGTAVVLLGAALTLRHLARRSPGPHRFGPLDYAASAGVLALTLHSLTDFNLAIPANAITFSVLAGLVMAWRRGRVPVAACGIDRVRRLPRGRLLSTCTAAFALMTAAVAGTGAGFLDSDDAEASFARAAEEAEAPLSDLRVLTESAAAGTDPSKLTLDYVRGRLERAISIEEAGLRCAPTSSRGHLELGRLLAALCSTDAVARGPSGVCALKARSEFRAALRLSPMSAWSHAQVARFYVTAWPALGEAMRLEAGAVIERAVALNPGDDRLRGEWRAVRGDVSAGS